MTPGLEVALIPIVPPSMSFFFFNDTATTEIYTLSLHDALPISCPRTPCTPRCGRRLRGRNTARPRARRGRCRRRSEEHTSELQSLRHLVCRLLLDKKNQTIPRLEHRRPDGRFCLLPTQSRICEF